MLWQREQWYIDVIILEVCKLNETNNQYFSGYRGLGGNNKGLVGVCISVTRAKKERVWVRNGS